MPAATRPCVKRLHIKGIHSTDPALPWGAQLGALVCSITSLQLEGCDLLTTDLQAFIEACPHLAEIELCKDVALTLPAGARLAAPAASQLTKLVLGNYVHLEFFAFAPIAAQITSLTVPPPFRHFMVRVMDGDPAVRQQFMALRPNIRASVLETGRAMSTHYRMLCFMLRGCSQLQEITFSVEPPSLLMRDIYMRFVDVRTCHQLTALPRLKRVSIAFASHAGMGTVLPAVNESLPDAAATPSWGVLDLTGRVRVPRTAATTLKHLPLGHVRKLLLPTLQFRTTRLAEEVAAAAGALGRVQGSIVSHIHADKAVAVRVVGAALPRGGLAAVAAALAPLGSLHHLLPLGLQLDLTELGQHAWTEAELQVLGQALGASVTKLCISVAGDGGALWPALLRALPSMPRLSSTSLVFSATEQQAETGGDGGGRQLYARATWVLDVPALRSFCTAASAAGHALTVGLACTGPPYFGRHQGQPQGLAELVQQVQAHEGGFRLQVEDAREAGPGIADILFAPYDHL